MKHKYSSPPQGFCKALTPEAHNFPFQIVKVRVRFPLLQGCFLDHGISPSHFNILKRPSLWVGRCGFHANAGLWIELSELPGRWHCSLSQTRLLKKTNDLTVLSFLPVGHIQAGLESPNIRRMRGTGVERSGTDVRAWTENESFFLSVFWRGICHISGLKSRYPSACWGELNSVIIEIDMLCLAGNINTLRQQQTANAPPWVLKWNGSTGLLQRRQQHDSNPCSVSLLTRQ